MSISGYKLEPVKLRDNWSGFVLAACRADGSTAAPARALPTLAEWLPFLEQLTCDPQGLPDSKTLKFSLTGEVLEARVGPDSQSLRVICKQTRAPGFRRRLVTLVRGTRERRNFHRALALLDAGVHTPRPLALAEHRAPARLAWLVTEFIPDLADLDQVAFQFLPRVDGRDLRAVKEGILNALVAFLRRMDSHNLPHRDLKASNILLENWDGRGEPVRVWLADLDGLGRRRPVSAKKRRRQVMRLGASLLEHRAITRTDFCRFWRAYASESAGPGGWKKEFRDLAHGARDYARRARRRKTHKLDGYGTTA